MEPIISTTGLSKTFGSFRAVHDLSFSIGAGEVYGFLGQNGAGKSTTMRMLLGLIFPDAGSILIKGQPFSNSSRHLLRHIGAIIERPDMYGYLSGWDNLKMFAAISGTAIPTARLKETLELVGLTGREKDKVKAYSQGMKQRLGIAIALVHQPDLLILDEPTNGLDPQGIAEMRELVLRLSREHGKTILISSHLLHEIELMASSMLIIHKGQKMAEGKVGELLNASETLVEIVLRQLDPALLSQIESSKWHRLLQKTAAATITFKMDPALTPELNAWLAAIGAPIMEIKSRHSLEAFFLSLTNEPNVTDRAI